MDLPTIIIGWIFFLAGLSMHLIVFGWIVADMNRSGIKNLKKITFYQKKSSIEKVYLIFQFTIRDPKLFFGVFSTKSRAENFVTDQKDWRMVNYDIRLIDGLYYVLHDKFTSIHKICYSLEEAKANFKTNYEMVELLECYVDNPSKDHCIKKYDSDEDPKVIERMLKLSI